MISYYFFLDIWKDYKTDEINKNSTKFKIYINLEHFSNDENKYQWKFPNITQNL